MAIVRRANNQMKLKSVFLLAPALLLCLTLFAQAPTAPTMGPPPGQGPMTEKEVITELKKQGADQLMKDLGSRGADFEIDPEVEKRLRKAKATDQVMAAVKAAGPKERENAAKSAAQASGAIILPPDDRADFTALQSELDPDKVISLAEAFAQKHPNSPVLTYVYAYEANAYQNKGDVAKMVDSARKSLMLKKDNLMSLMMLTYALPTPQYTSAHQADEEQLLTEAEKCDQEAVAAVAGLKKQPSESDEKFAQRKAGYLAELHADVGMIHLDRAQLGLMGLDQGELAKAEAEYKLAISTTARPDPTYYFRLGDACRLQHKYDQALAAYTKCSELSQGPLKEFADKQVQAVKQLMAQAGAAPKP